MEAEASGRRGWWVWSSTQVGLVQGHAYSVLRVKKVGDLQFVQVSYMYSH